MKSISILLILFLSSMFSSVSAEEAESAQNSDTAVSEVQTAAVQPLILSVQYGKGGSVREFHLNDGDSIWVSSEKPGMPAAQPQLAETPEAATYRTQLGVVSQQISEKITAIQKKQAELANELFPAEQQNIATEKTLLENELATLETRRNQLQSQQVAKESLNPPTPPPPTPNTAEVGFSIKIALAEKSATLTLSTSGEERGETSIEAPLNQWVRIIEATKGQGSDIWAKISPTGE